METGCPPPELLVMVSMTSGMRSRPTRWMVSRSSDIHVAFEGMDEVGLAALGDDEVESLGAGGFNIGAGGVEVSVVGYDSPVLTMVLNRIRSAARPWCVGMTWV